MKIYIEIKENYVASVKVYSFLEFPIFLLNYQTLHAYRFASAIVGGINLYPSGRDIPLSFKHV
eukprot:snap_masked-scaffold_11-processed-gene-8.26-mRNA-1 protein AED:1.00 eAED:1.00 QI:0/-1/0/0/-1/1/1/0/62